jgi:hypothetical protein
VPGPPPALFGARGGALAGSRPGAGVFGDGQSLTAALAYIDRHGGGTLAVSSQSSAASAIIAQRTAVAGIGGFSGRESAVSVAWLAAEVRSGRIRWVLADGRGTQGGARLPGDTRMGSTRALAAVAKACQVVSLSSAASGEPTGSGRAAAGTLYDCQGRSTALLSAGA